MTTRPYEEMALVTAWLGMAAFVAEVERTFELLADWYDPVNRRRRRRLHQDYRRRTLARRRGARR